MGYQSSVTFVIKGEKEAVLAHLAAFRLVRTLDPSLLEAFNEVKQIPEAKDLVLKYEGDDVKWYDSYPDVRLLEALYQHFAETEGVEGPLFEGAFCRIGEEADDNVERHFGENGWELCQIRRSIECAY